jgi:hypothetical protein
MNIHVLSGIRTRDPSKSSGCRDGAATGIGFFNGYGF